MPTTPTVDEEQHSVPSDICGHPVPTRASDCPRAACLAADLDDDRRFAFAAGLK